MVRGKNEFGMSDLTQLTAVIFKSLAYGSPLSKNICKHNLCHNIGLYISILFNQSGDDFSYNKTLMVPFSLIIHQAHANSIFFIADNDNILELKSTLVTNQPIVI